MHSWTRVSARLSFLLMTACSQPASEAGPQANATLADIDFMCATVPVQHAYHAEKADVWDAACTQARADAAALTNEGTDMVLLGRLMDALHDNHIHYGRHADGAFRLAPHGADYGFEGDVVTAVRADTQASRAGLRVGDRITHIDGAPLEIAARARLYPPGYNHSDAQKTWARQSTASGVHGRDRSVTVARDGEATTFTMTGDVYPGEASRALPDVSARRITDVIGLIRFNDSLYKSDTAVAAFDEALASLPDARALILDLRDTPSGGNTDVAEPIMGRFITQPLPYQRFLPVDAEPWTDEVEPRGETFTGPVAVMVGKWTGSMGEGMAIGLDGMGRATVIGGEMSRLGGAMHDFTLPSGVPVKLVQADLLHLDGTRRHEWLPPVRAVADNGDGPDLALAKAVDVLGAALQTAR